MKPMYIVLFLPVLGLVAYPNWKRVLQLSFAFSLLSLELLTLSRAFENPVLGLGFGFLSFGIPYSLILNQTNKNRGFSIEVTILLIVWAAGVIYFAANRGMGDSFTVVKIAAITCWTCWG